MNNESPLFFWLIDFYGFTQDPQYRRLRWLLAAVLSVALVAGGGLGGRLYQIHEKYLRYRAEGMAAADMGDARLALDRLGMYLDRHPTDVEALAAYCRVRPTVIDPAGRYYLETITALQRLVALDGNRLEQRRTLMRLLVEHGPPGAAVDQASIILQSAPDDAESLAICTRDAVLRRQLGEALASDARWQRVAPVDLPTELAILDLIRETPRSEPQLIARCDAELATHPDEAASWVVAARGFAMAGNVKREIQINLLEMALDRLRMDKAGASDITLATALAEQLDHCGHFTDALDVLSRCATLSGQTKASYALGRRLWIAGQWDQADAELGAPGAATPSDVLALIGISASRAGRRETAERISAELGRRHNDLAATCRAMINWTGTASRRSVGEAADLLAKLQKTPPYMVGGRDWTAIWWYFAGEAEAALGETDLALLAWERAAVFSPAWPTPLLRAVPMLSESGQWEAALKLALEANRRAPRNIAVALALAQTWMDAIHHGDGEDVWPKKASLPAHFTARALHRLVDSIVRQAPTDEQALCLRIELLARVECTRPLAISAIDAMIEDPSGCSLAGYLRLAAISHRGRLGKEEQCVVAAEQKYGMSAQIAQARAVLQLEATGGPHGFDRPKIAATRPSNSNDAIEWEIARVRALDAAGAAEASVAVAALADAHPDSLAAQQEVLQSFAGRNDPALLERVVERLRRLTGSQGVKWRLAKVRLLLLQSQHQHDSLIEAQELLQGILAVAPTSLEAHSLLAELYETTHNPGKAAVEWSSAAMLAPDSAAVALARARALRESGDLAGAKIALDRLALRPPTQHRQRIQLARLLADCGEPDRAIAIIAPVELTGNAAQVEENGLLLADLYSRALRFDDAQRVLDRLLKTPSLPVVVMASDLLASRGDTASSKALLHMLDGMSLPPGVRELVIADHTSKFESAEAAIPLYRTACDAAPRLAASWKGLIACCIATGKSAEAKSAAAAGAAAVPADAALHRLHADPTLLSPTSDPDLRSLVLAVAENPEEDAVAVRALRICTARNGSPQMNAAQLDDLSNAQPTLAPVQFLAVKHNLAIRNFPRAAAIAERSMRLFPGSPDPCRWLYFAFAASAEPANALRAAEQWRARLALVPLLRARSEAFDADMARAQCLSYLGRRDEVIAALRPHAARALADPKANVPWIHLYVTSRLARGDAGALTELCDQLRPLLHNPQGREIWIRIASEIPNPNSAAVWIAEASDAVPADDAVQRVWLGEAWHLLFMRHPTADCMSREREALAPLIDRPAPVPQAVFALANFAEQEGDTARAQANYRRVLELQGGDNLAKIRPIAANNLANLLLGIKSANPHLSEAISLGRDAVTAQPDVAAFHDTLASAYALSKQYPVAADELGDAIRLEPLFKYQVRLAQVLADGAHTADARRLVEQLQDEIGGGLIGNVVSPMDRYQLQQLSRRLDADASEPATKDPR